MLRGNLQAKIDDKGRLKVPSVFRAFIEQTYGPHTAVFVTSLSGEYALVYPMPVWESIELKLAQVPNSLPAKSRYQDRVNYYGQIAELDNQGRVVIHPRLRESAQINGEVDVFGNQDHLKVWNHDRFVAIRLQEPLTDVDLLDLAKFGL